MSIIVCSMLFIDVNNSSNKRRILFISIMSIIAIAVILITYLASKSYLQGELKKNGIVTYGTVIGFEGKEHKTGKSDYAIFKYEFENKEYIQKVITYDYKHKVNQILRLNISSREPNMFEIIENE
jgi:hypothetical protein